MNKLGTSDLASDMERVAYNQHQISDQVASETSRIKDHVTGHHIQTRAILTVMLVMCTLVICVCTILQILGFTNAINSRLDSIETHLNDIDSTMISMDSEMYSVWSEMYSIRNETTNNDLASQDDEVAPAEESPDKLPEYVEPTSESSNIVLHSTSDLLTPTGFTAEQFQDVIDDTFTNILVYDDPSYYSNFGQALYEVEQEYNYNALYLLGISGLESGYGTSRLATKANNSFGLVGMQFDTVYDSVKYCGKLIKESYIDAGLTTISSIGKKYCPPNCTSWASGVQWITNQYIKSADALVSKVSS